MVKLQPGSDPDIGPAANPEELRSRAISRLPAVDQLILCEQKLAKLQESNMILERQHEQLLLGAREVARRWYDTHDFSEELPEGAFGKLIRAGEAVLLREITSHLTDKDQREWSPFAEGVSVSKPPGGIDPTRLPMLCLLAASELGSQGLEYVRSTIDTTPDGVCKVVLYARASPGKKLNVPKLESAVSRHIKSRMLKLYAEVSTRIEVL